MRLLHVQTNKHKQIRIYISAIVLHKY